MIVIDREMYNVLTNAYNALYTYIIYIYIHIFLKTLYTSASSALRKRFFNSVADAPRRRSRLLREKSFGKMVNFAWPSTTSDARQRKQIKTMINPCTGDNDCDSDHFCCYDF